MARTILPHYQDDEFENLISLGGMSPPAMTNDFLAYEHYELTQSILWKIDLSLAFQAFHSETNLQYFFKSIPFLE
jgi:hypothetical protein